MSISNHNSLLDDPEKFEKLFRDYFGPMSYYAVKLIKDEDKAREIVQSVFISLWEKRKVLHTNSPIRSYLFTAVHNRCLNLIRDNRKFYKEGPDRLNDMPEDQDNPQKKMEDQELEALIFQGISQLPEKCAQIFKLSRIEGKKYREIAGIMNISVKTVEAQMSKALTILRNYLHEYLNLILFFLLSRFL